VLQCVLHFVAVRVVACIAVCATKIRLAPQLQLAAAVALPLLWVSFTRFGGWRGGATRNVIVCASSRTEP